MIFSTTYKKGANIVSSFLVGLSLLLAPVAPAFAQIFEDPEQDLHDGLRSQLGDEAYNALLAETDRASLSIVMFQSGYTLLGQLAEQAGPVVTGNFINTSGGITAGSFLTANGSINVANLLNDSGVGSVSTFLDLTGQQNASLVLNNIGSQDLSLILNRSGGTSFGNMINDVGVQNFLTVFNGVGGENYQEMNASIGTPSIQRLIEGIGPQAIVDSNAISGENSLSSLSNLVRSYGARTVVDTINDSGILGGLELLTNLGIEDPPGPQSEPAGQSPEFLLFQSLFGQSGTNQLVAEFGLGPIELFVRTAGAENTVLRLGDMTTADFVDFARDVGLEDAATFFVSVQEVDSVDFKEVWDNLLAEERTNLMTELGVQEFKNMFYAIKGLTWEDAFGRWNSDDIIDVAAAFGFGGVAEIFFSIEENGLINGEITTEDLLAFAQGFVDLGPVLALFEEWEALEELFNGMNTEDFINLAFGEQLGGLIGGIAGLLENGLPVDQLTDLAEQYGSELLGNVLDQVGLGQLEDFISGGVGPLGDLLGDILSGDLSVDSVVNAIGSAFGFGRNRGTTPFGGTIRGPFVPCICSFNGFIVGRVEPVPGGISAPILFYNLFASRLFPNYRPYPGRLTLGLRDERPVPTKCRVGVPPFACFFVPAAATINIIGTN